MEQRSCYQLTFATPQTLINLGLILYLFVLNACSLAQNDSSKPQIAGGIADLSTWSFDQDGIVPLTGTWAFYPNQLLTETDLSTAEQAFINVPNQWADANNQEHFPEHQGCATYHLRLTNLPETKLALSVKHINTAYKLFLNGQLALQNGQVGCSPNSSVPDYTNRLYFFDNQENEIDLLLQVSNYHARNMGIPTALSLGPAQKMVATGHRKVFLDAFLFGALLIIALYHFILYLVRQRDRSLLYFALIALAMSIRSLLTGERLLYSLSTPDYWSFLFGLDYLTYTLGSLFFMVYIHSIFPKEYPRWQVWTIGIPSIVYSLIILFSPSAFFNQLLPFYQLVTTIGLLFILVGLVFIIVRRRGNAKLFAASFLALILGATNDILHFNAIYLFGVDNLIFLGAFLFFIAQSVLLGDRFSKAFNKVQALSRDLQKSVDNQVQLNQAIKRFVPVQFLQELGKAEYSEIQMGDSTAKVMTVLFSDLRSFSKLSESLNPQQNFKFLNSYLRRMEPHIEKHGGFVDKYIGDAIMALFRDREPEREGSADAALRTALALRLELKQFNEHRANSNYAAIDFGIGINTGELMLGTLGSENRLDTTVIGDTVNLASRLEALTKYFGSPILLSDFTYQALADPNIYHLRKIDLVRVPGKEKPVIIYELISNEDPDFARKKMASLINFYHALDLYANRQFEAALKALEQIHAYNPADSVVAIYIDRCREHIAHPPPDNWNRVVEIKYK